MPVHSTRRRESLGYRHCALSAGAAPRYAVYTYALGHVCAVYAHTDMTRCMMRDQHTDMTRYMMRDQHTDMTRWVT
jgi:hypothetical protein